MPEKPTPPHDGEPPRKKPFLKGVRIRIYKGKKPRAEERAAAADEVAEKESSQDLEKIADEVPEKIPEPIEAYYARASRENQNDPRFRRPLARVSPTEKAGLRKRIKSRRNYQRVRAGFVAGLLMGLTLGLTPSKSREKKPAPGPLLTKKIARILREHEMQRFTHFDEIPGIKRVVPGGELSATEKASHMDPETVPGLTIFHDIGRDYVFVPRGQILAAFRSIGAYSATRSDAPHNQLRFCLLRIKKY